jgi:ubiquitin-conjugating enzyme E2 A
VLTSIRSLLCDPNPESPANQVAAQLFKTDRKEYERKVLEIVHLTIEDDDSDPL